MKCRTHVARLARLSTLDERRRIQACGSTKDDVSQMMLKVGFSKKMMTDPVTTLSGGWRMKLALSRAMLQNADILLMALSQRLSELQVASTRRLHDHERVIHMFHAQDEPTNHLDVMNVKWVKDYIKSLTNVTCIMVSHDSGADSEQKMNLNLTLSHRWRPRDVSTPSTRP